MLPQKQAEEAIVPSNLSETEHDGKEEEKEEAASDVFSVKSLLWHGGSSWDAWFSCASNQVNKMHPLITPLSLLLLPLLLLQS